LIIGIDLQTLETPEADRGIGRCARGLAEAFARLCPRHRIVGFGFTDGPPARLAAADLPNFEYRRFGLPHDRAAYRDAGILAPLGWQPALADLDIYLLTSTLMLDVLLPDGAPFPIVALLHDLIPLLYRDARPEIFTEHAWSLYDARLEMIKSYDFRLSDSEASRQDAIRLLGLAPETIRMIGVGIDDVCFERLPDAAIRRARETAGIRDPYILSVSGFSFHKNWEGVIRAFAALPAADRRAHQLAIVCRLDSQSRNAFVELAEREGVASRVVLTGGVDDATLRGLYQGAAALLFPSFAEGFGIPMTEAMAAGTPIVGSDLPVFREVAGEAARLVDPRRADLLAEALHGVLHDAPLRRALVEEGRRQVEGYRWPQVIERAEAALRAVAEPPAAESVARPAARARPAPSGPRVAYFTVLPPQLSGIADYNERLVQELVKHVDLDLFLDDIEPAHPWIRANVPWRSSREFPRLHRARPYDILVYQMGNNTLHGRHYRLATYFPGIVLLHDYALRLFFPLLNRTFSFLETRDDIERYYGLTFGPALSPPEILAQLELIPHPLNERLIERSRGLVVHSGWCRDQIRRRFADTPVEVVPFGVEHDPLEDGVDPGEVRRRRRIAPDAFVVTCAGNLTPTKRLHSLLYAFADLLASVPEAVLCLVGRVSDPRYLRRLHQIVDDLRLAGRVRFLGYVEMADLYGILEASDVCVNLRHPTLGETSAVQLRMMELGKPILISAVAQFLEYPDAVCWKVDVDGAEQMQLVRYLRVLARDPEVRRRLGENARRYVRQWTWETVAVRHVEAWERIMRLSRTIAAAQPSTEL